MITDDQLYRMVTDPKVTMIACTAEILEDITIGLALLKQRVNKPTQSEIEADYIKRIGMLFDEVFALFRNNYGTGRLIEVLKQIETETLNGEKNDAG